MQVLHTIAQVRSVVSQHRAQGQSIGFVPTMGNLHEGHLSLVRAAEKVCDVVLMSIFVNPLQFGPNEDFDAYPRTLEADVAQLSETGCAYVFAPSVNEMYPNGQLSMSSVYVPDVSEGACGGSRPGHFDGVATVVTKLFNTVQADKAFFGKKDFQQLAVIRKCVADLNSPTEIIGCETVRESDGLAKSSRNQYLTASERESAPALYRTLETMKTTLQEGLITDFERLKALAIAQLEKAGFQPDYIEFRDALSLQPATKDTTDIVILAAAKLGKARLIDNIDFSLR